MSFKYRELKTEKLAEVKLTINSNLNKPGIKGVGYYRLTTHLDGRGDLTELWSKAWLSKMNLAVEVRHVYFNITHEGVIKGWHVHEKTVSQYTCVLGKMQVVLVDLRKNSKTYGLVDRFIIGEKNPSIVIIPPGVLKAWKSLKGDSVIVNLLSSEDKKDNYKYPWDAILVDIWGPTNG